MRLPILIALLSAQLFAKCPDWIQKADIPLCPPGNATVLPDTYPALAHVVSDSPAYQTRAAGAFTVNYVEQVLLHSGDKPPLLVLPVSKETFHKVRDHIATLKVPDAQKNQWLANLVWAEGATSYTWQQDYFMAASNGGKVELRSIRDYESHDRKFPTVSSFSRMAQALTEACPELVTIGESLPPERETQHVFRSATMGGNIMALPGGLCVHGRNQPWDTFAKYYCGDKANDVTVDTSWLEVGHIDELISVVKTGEGPCDFVIAIASPRKALQLLAEDPDGHFFDFYAHDANIPKDELQRDRFVHTPAFQLCYELAHQLGGKAKLPPGIKLEQSKSDVWNWLIPEAFADGKRGGNGPLCNPKWFSKALRYGGALLLAGVGALALREVTKTAVDCSKMTNRQILDMFHRSYHLKYANLQADEALDDIRETLTRRLKERLPACTPKFVPVPALFHDDGEGRINTVHPNPANSVMVDRTLLSPHPQNASFARYLQDTFGKLGVQSNFIDTHDYAHVGAGNLHCATHQIRYCRKR